METYPWLKKYEEGWPALIYLKRYLEARQKLPGQRLYRRRRRHAARLHIMKHRQESVDYTVSTDADLDVIEDSPYPIKEEFSLGNESVRQRAILSSHEVLICERIT